MDSYLLGVLYGLVGMLVALVVLSRETEANDFAATEDYGGLGAAFITIGLFWPVAVVAYAFIGLGHVVGWVIERMTDSTATETPMQQIDKLANFIMAEVEGEPSLNEGAVDTAIRLIRGATPRNGRCRSWPRESWMITRRQREMTDAATVTRTRSVLELITSKYQGEKTFAKPHEGADGRTEMDGTRPYVRLSTEQWEDLGSPSQLTVAIWPGDRQDLMEDDSLGDPLRRADYPDLRDFKLVARDEVRSILEHVAREGGSMADVAQAILDGWRDESLELIQHERS